MTTRRQYLVCYDIREARRLRRIHRAMLGWGEWLQYSVFLCELDRRELLGMRGEVGEIIHHGQDSVMVVDLGDAGERTAPIEFIGTPLTIAGSGPRII